MVDVAPVLAHGRNVLSDPVGDRGIAVSPDTIIEGGCIDGAV